MGTNFHMCCQLTSQQLYSIQVSLLVCSGCLKSFCTKQLKMVSFSVFNIGQWTLYSATHCWFHVWSSHVIFLLCHRCRNFSEYVFLVDLKKKYFWSLFVLFSVWVCSKLNQLSLSFGTYAKYYTLTALFFKNDKKLVVNACVTIEGLRRAMTEGLNVW